MPSFSSAWLDEGTIAAIVEGFESATLPRPLWDRHAHLIVGSWYGVHFPPEEASARMRAGILAYNAAMGIERTPTSGYHETITAFWMGAIAHHLATLDPSLPVAQRIASVVARYPDSSLPLTYYSLDVLLSAAARTTVVPPDRHPLPWPPITIGVL